MTRLTGLLLTLALIGGCSSAGGSDEGVASDPPTESSPPTTTGATADDVPAIITALEDSDVASPAAWTGANGLTSFVAPGFESGTADAESAAFDYLAAFAEAYGLADPASRFVVVSVTETTAGTVVRLEQFLDGLPVFAGHITIVVDGDGRIGRVTGIVAPDAELAPAGLSADDALAVALDAVDGSRPGDAESRLVAFSPAVEEASTEPPVPAWEVTVLTGEAVPFEELVIVHALDGSVLLRVALDHDTENWDVLDAGNALDDDGEATIGKATLVLQATDGEVTEVAPPDADATDLADHLRTTWRYFWDTHGRDGFDDAGGRCRAYVHVGVDWYNATANANCTMRYGDADAFASALDIVAHEFTHAVTRRTADLVYQGQSGAINEHYSDFFGKIVDPSDWTISVISRSLSSPAVDRWGEFWVTEDDKGGVHSNSGIGNKAGFLVGDTGRNTHPDTGVEVQGIGRAKAGTLWYATLLSLAPRTAYTAWACATIFTARDLEQAGGLDDADVESVEAAMAAVELVDPMNPIQPCRYGIVGSVTSDADGVEPDRDDRAPEDSVPTSTDPADDDGSTPTTDPADDDGSTTTTSVPDEDDECGIVGVWRMRDQEFFDQITRLTGIADDTRFEYDSGDYLLEINADGTTVARRQEWSWRASTDAGVVIMRISSVDPGRWDAQDRTITLSDEASSATVTILLEVGGNLIPLPTGSQVTVDTPGVHGTGTYTCVNDVLTITTTVDGMPFTAVFDRRS